MIRFFVSPDRMHAVWRHELDPREGTEYADWIDVTDMDDAQFDAFMREHPLIKARNSG